MQISFDPLQQEEAAAVRAMLDVLHAQQVGKTFGTVFEAHVHRDDHSAGNSTAFKLTSAEFPTITEPAVSAVSAAPLAPPVPSTAAADLFSTAPAAPQDGQATQPAVPAPPVPVPSVPTAPVASPSLADVDSTGLPWDERIHSGTKAKNADGTWRARRGMNDAAKVKEVEAELRALMALSGSPLSTSVATVAQGTESSTNTTGDMTESAQSATAPVAPAADTATVQVGSIPTPPSAPVAVAPIPQPPAPDAPNAAPATSAPPTAPIPSPPVPPAPTAEGSTVPDTFGPLMTYLAKSVTEGKTTEAQIHEVFGRHGIEKGKFGQLISKPDVLAAIVGELRLMGI